MIRLYLTTWSYIINSDGIKESTNPLLEAINANPQIEVTYSIVDSPMLNGEHIKPAVMVILKGDNIPDAADDLVGVKRIPIDSLDKLLGDIIASRRAVIVQWLTDNTGVDTTQFTLSNTIKDVIKAIAVDLNPSFQGFGAIYESLVNDWQ